MRSPGTLVPRVVLGGALGLITLAALEHPGISRDPPWYSLMGAGLLACLAGPGLAVLSIPRRARIAAAALALLLIWRVAGTLGSLDPFRSKLNLVAWLGVAALWAGLLTGVRTVLAWRIAAGWMVGLACFLSLAGLASGQLSRLAGGFSNADTFSLLPLTSVFLAGGLRSWFVPAQLFLVAATLMTGSRAAAVGLVAGWLTQLVLMRLAPGRDRVGGAAVLTMAALTLFLVVCVLGWGRWTELFSGGDSQGLVMRRDVLWHGARTALARPWLGSGPGTFALAYQEFRPVSIVPDYVFVNVAHNDYVEMAVESGWPGLALWLAWMGLCWHRSWRYATRSHLHREAAGTTSAVSAAAAFMLFNFGLAVPATLFWLGGVLALSVVLPVRAEERLFVPAPVALALVAAGALAIGYCWRGHEASELVEQARQESRQLRLEEALPRLESAARLAPDWSLVRLRLAEALSLMSEATGDPGPSRQALEQISRARALSPRDQDILATQARLQLAADDVAGAERTLQEAVRFAPYQSRFRRGLLMVALRRGQTDEAAFQAVELYRLNPDNQGMVTRFLERLDSKVVGQALDRAGLPPERLWPQGRK